MTSTFLSSTSSTSMITSPRPYATISRTEHFSSAHRLHSPLLSNEENVALFGPCNNIHYHGHNYTLEVYIRGPIHPITGMVVNLTDLKKAIRESILQYLDHKNLDLDVDFFKHVPSTTENLAVFIYDELKRTLPKYIPEMDSSSLPITSTSSSSASSCLPKLDKVVIWETIKNKVEYYGEKE